MAFLVGKALGLSRCRLCLSGAAPISHELVEYLQSINLPIYEASSCLQIYSLPHDNMSLYTYMYVFYCVYI